MKWVKHEFAEWAAMTQELAAIEEGVLSRLLHWQFVNEDALPVGTDELRRITRSIYRDEVQAMERVLALHFVPTELGWIHPPTWSLMAELGLFDDRPDQRCVTVSRGASREIGDTTPVSRVSLGASRPVSRSVTSQKQRQRALRERKARMHDLLATKDVFPGAHATVAELVSLCRTHGIELPDEVLVSRGVTPVSRPTHPRSLNTKDIGSQDPDQGAHSGAGVTRGVTHANGSTTAAGAIGKLFRDAGMPPLSLNLGHPKLLQLIEAGCTPEEFAGAAQAAVARGKGFAYALAALEGQRRDAAASGPVPGAVDMLALLAPGLAAQRDAAKKGST